jgi:hypothetical protein
LKGTDFLKKSRCRWDDDIKMDLEEIGYDVWPVLM